VSDRLAKTFGDESPSLTRFVRKPIERINMKRIALLTLLLATLAAPKAQAQNPPPDHYAPPNITLGTPFQRPAYPGWWIPVNVSGWTGIQLVTIGGDDHLGGNIVLFPSSTSNPLRLGSYNDPGIYHSCQRYDSLTTYWSNNPYGPLGIINIQRTETPNEFLFLFAAATLALPPYFPPFQTPASGTIGVFHVEGEGYASIRTAPDTYAEVCDSVGCYVQSVNVVIPIQGYHQQIPPIWYGQSGGEGGGGGHGHEEGVVVSREEAPKEVKAARRTTWGSIKKFYR